MQYRIRDHEEECKFSTALGIDSIERWMPLGMLREVLSSMVSRQSESAS